MKDSIRLFVAAELPPTLIAKLQEQQQHFKHDAIRFVPRQNLHLTLYFIGNVPLEELAGIKERIAAVAHRHQPFLLQYEQTEPGPKPTFPRLIWARFTTHPAFESLSLELTEALSQQPPKKQKPIPHVTLARFRKDAKPPKHLPAIAPDEPLELPVQQIALWQSVLGSPHPGYSVLASYALG